MRRLVVAAALVLATTTLRAEEVVRVGALINIGSLPFYAAVDQRYFEAEGVKVEITPMPPGPRVMQALASGALDVAQVATLTVLTASRAGLDVVIVAPASNFRADGAPSTGLVLRPDPALRSVKDLRGRVIGVHALRSINHLLTLEALANAGIRPDEVTWREVEFAHMPAALEHRQLDAAALTEPYLTVLRDRGVGTSVGPPPALAGASLTVFTSTRKLSAQRAAALARFRRALRRGAEYCRDHPVEARKLVTQYTGVAEQDASRVLLHDFPLAVEPRAIAPVATLARRHGLLDADVDVSRLIVAGDAPSR